MNERAGSSSEKPSPAPHSPQITPPAAEEKRTDAAARRPAAARAVRQLRQEPGGEQQLQPEREQVRRAGRLGPRIEQLQLAAEEVVRGGVRLPVAEHPQHGLARRAGGEDRATVLAQPRVPLDRLGLGDGVQLSRAPRRARAAPAGTAPAAPRSATSCGARPSRPRSRARACPCRDGRSDRPRAAASSGARRLRSCSSRPTSSLTTAGKNAPPVPTLSRRHRMETSLRTARDHGLHDRPLRPLHQGEGPAAIARPRLRRGQPRQGPGRPPPAGRVHRSDDVPPDRDRRRAARRLPGTAGGRPRRAASSALAA